MKKPMNQNNSSNEPTEDLVTIALLMSEPLPACCDGCKSTDKKLEWRRMNTMFVDDRSNWMFSCLECYQVEFGYYEERWDDLESDLRAGVFAGNMLP